MKGDPIYYQGGYKYRMTRPGSINLNLFRPFPRLRTDIATEYITLTKDGILGWAKNYAWDGCSGPTFDDDSNMRGGAWHDMGYQLMRDGLLPLSYRGYFDDILRLVCLDDGMQDFRAWYYHESVEHFAEKCATPGYDPYPELSAPTFRMPLFNQLCPEGLEA
jgi:hypothetical protein